jgi:CheY-like chemotaxis protein
MATVLRKKLEKKGHRISLFDNGYDVLEAIKHTKPDLILLEVKLPVINGLNVLAELKNQPDTNSIPVIMISNLDQTSPKDLRSADSNPTELYLVKSSWTLSALQNKVEKTLSDLK